MLPSPPEGTAHHKLAWPEGSCGEEGNGFLTPPHPHQPVHPFTSSHAITAGRRLTWRAGEEVGGDGLSGKKNEDLGAVLLTVATQGTLEMNHKQENGIGRKSELMETFRCKVRFSLYLLSLCERHMHRSSVEGIRQYLA